MSLNDPDFYKQFKCRRAAILRAFQKDNRVFAIVPNGSLCQAVEITGFPLDEFAKEADLVFFGNEAYSPRHFKSVEPPSDPDNARFKSQVFMIEGALSFAFDSAIPAEEIRAGMQAPRPEKTARAENGPHLRIG